MDSHPKEGHYLETNILGSVKGAGKFLESQNPKQREWLESSVPNSLVETSTSNLLAVPEHCSSAPAMHASHMPVSVSEQVGTEED